MRKGHTPMIRELTIKPDFLVAPLLSIENKEFAHWYELGAWWALYGDEQGRGPYYDRYLIENISDGIQSGWYNNPRSGWLPMVGFFIGMVHGGMYDPATRVLRS